MAEETTPQYNLEEGKELRAHVISRSQAKWFALWFFIGITFLLFPWLPAKVIGIAAWLIGGLGGFKYEDGLGYKIARTVLESLNKRRRTQERNEIATATEKPIGLGIIGFPTELAPPEMPEDLIVKKDEVVVTHVVEKNELELMEDDYLRDDLSFELGAIYNPRENSDTSFVIGTGMDAASLDSAGLMEAQKGVVNAIRQTALSSEQRLSFSVIYSTRPYNIQRHKQWNEESLDPDVLTAVPAGFSADSGFAPDSSPEQRQATMLLQTETFATLLGADCTMAVAMTVPRPGSWPKMNNGDISEVLSTEQIQNAPITRLTLLLESEIAAAGVSGVAACSTEDVAKLVRTGWDIKNIRQWQKLVADRARLIAEVLARPELRGFVTIPPEPSAWPEKEIVSSRAKNRRYNIATDGTYHRILQAKRHLKRRVFAEDFFDLFKSRDLGFGASTGLTIATCGDIVNVSTENKMLTRRIVIRDGFRRQRPRDLHMSLEDQDKDQLMQRKQDSMYLGGMLAFSYNVFIDIAALSPEGLDTVEAAFRSHAKKIGLRVRYIKWETRQIRALLTTLFGVSMAAE